jgi:hypothetical protein
LPSAQCGHEPPQSTSVSVPFFAPSVHKGDWQVTLHTPLAQSPPALHASPTAHFGQVPPQSTSDSDPFFTLSLQKGARHVTLQTLLVQSWGAPHF